MRDVVRRVLIGAFVASALLGALVGFRVGSPSQVENRIFVTAWLLSAAGLIGYVCVPSITTPYWRAVGAVGLAATVVATAMTLIAIWGDVREGAFISLIWTVATAALTCAWASTLPNLHVPRRTVVLWAGVLAALSLTAGLALLVIWTTNEAVARAFVAAFLVTVALTASLAAYRRLGPPSSATAGATSRFCPACGAALPATSDGRSCPSCGASFSVSFGA